eukprot:2328844-Amphidinium_carterae.2
MDVNAAFGNTSLSTQQARTAALGKTLKQAYKHCYPTNTCRECNHSNSCQMEHSYFFFFAPPGFASSNETDVGPTIDAAAHDKNNFPKSPLFGCIGCPRSTDAENCPIGWGATTSSNLHVMTA